jgi:hypothetical protein
MVPVWAPHHAEKGDPVAVVYYECKLNAKNECTPSGDLYYVHNAVAIEDLPATGGGGKVGHVSAWPQGAGPTIDELYICGPERAAQWAREIVKDVPHCHVTRGAAGAAKDHTWVTKAIYTYSVGEPIAWKVTEGGKVKDLHNGVFKFFQQPGGPEDPDIRKIIDKAGGETTRQGPCTLGVEHYVNNNPVSPKEDGRTAYKSWEKFILQSKKVEVEANQSITIKFRWE